MSRPETKQEYFYGSKFQRPDTIPALVLRSSVEAMNAARESNPFNRGVSGAVCRHNRVELWKLDQCADCKALLGPERQQQEKAHAAAVRRQDDEFPPQKRADAMHRRGVRIELAKLPVARTRTQALGGRRWTE